jgi:RNA polymerase sigma factor (sigma-70 family)
MTINAVNKEDNLIKDALSGKESAFKDLYELYKKALFLICLRYNNNKEDAEDRLQESFIKIFKELHQYDRAKGSFYTWCSRVTINTNLEHIRKQKIAFHEITEDKLDIMQEQYNVIADLELKEIILHVQKMPPGYRTVFNLYFFEGYNHKEIGEKLGISENTSKTQLMKSKTYLKTIINGVETTN